MHSIRILSGILAACFIFVPNLDAAPKKKRSAKYKKPAKQAQKLPESPAHPSSPQLHVNEYKQFVAQLKDIAKTNSFDLSPAIYIVLKATNDEFATAQWMQRAADEGIAPARFYVAQQSLLFLPEEQYKSPETKKAVALLKKASDAKYVPAMQEYSKCMRNGIGTIKNEQGANRLLVEACSSGSFETRFEWLKQTARLTTYADLQRPEVKAEIERGNHYILHYMSLRAPDDATITQMLVQAAGKGNGHALYELSELYKSIDIAKSYKLLNLAVRNRNPDALYRMAMYLIEPTTSLEINVGPIKNPAEGILMLKMAAMLGQPDAHAALARMYYTGKNGLKTDAQRAYAHVATGAANANRADLLAAQGFMLLTGHGTQQNTALGLNLLKIAARNKNTHAMSLLGYAYYAGLGVEKNTSTALLHFEDAVAHKDPIALIYLALMFNHIQEPSKSSYYLEHAERSLPGKAKTLFSAWLQTPGGWTLHPFAPENI